MRNNARERSRGSGRCGNGRRQHQRRLLDEARGRTDRMPPLPALLPYAPGPPGPLLRQAGARGRRGHGADRLRPLDRLLRRSDREEAAEPLPARLLGPLVRHGGLQPRLLLLPEPRHFQEPRSRAPEFRCDAGDDRPRRGAAGLRQRRLHLQRPGHLHGIRARHGGRLPRERDQERRGDRGLRLRGAAQAPLCRHGRRECRSQGLHRALLREALRRLARAGARDAQISDPRDRACGPRSRRC